MYIYILICDDGTPQLQVFMRSLFFIHFYSRCMQLGTTNKHTFITIFKTYLKHNTILNAKTGKTLCTIQMALKSSSTFG